MTPAAFAPRIVTNRPHVYQVSTHSILAALKRANVHRVRSQPIR
jgi:hypothetical protein